MAPNDSADREIDVLPIIQIIQNILNYATSIHEGKEPVDDKDNLDIDTLMLDVSSTYTIKRISQKITDDSMAVRNPNETTTGVLQMVSSYTWDAKVALTLAALAVNYAELLLITRLYQKNTLAKSIALLRESMEPIELFDLRKNERFNALNDLIQAILKVTKLLVKFQELPSQLMSSQSGATASIPSDIIAEDGKKTILCMVTCASQITSLMDNGFEYIKRMEKEDLSNLVTYVGKIGDELKEKLERCSQHIDPYENLKKLFAQTSPPSGIVPILTALTNPTGDQPPLKLNGSTSKKEANINELQGKKVLLLISDLRNLEEVLIYILKESKTKASVENRYEVVWLPISDVLLKILDKEKIDGKFKEMQSKMPWYSVHPSLIQPGVIKFIKEEWHFEKKPILVALDSQGKLACPNAVHMMYIWGDLVSPFDRKNEEQLWQEEKRTLIELLLYGVIDYKREKKLICFYGGKDTGMIQKFSAKVNSVVEAAKINIEMFNVGFSNGKEKITDKSSKWPGEIVPISLFWARLESMRYSKRSRQLKNHKTTENDAVMQWVLTILSYDASDRVWAVMGSYDGSQKIIKTDGQAFLNSFLNYDETKWKENVNQSGFIKALSDNLDNTAAAPSKETPDSDAHGIVPIHNN